MDSCTPTQFNETPLGGREGQSSHCRCPNHLHYLPASLYGCVCVCVCACPDPCLFSPLQSSVFKVWESEGRGGKEAFFILSETPLYHKVHLALLIQRRAMRTAVSRHASMSLPSSTFLNFMRLLTVIIDHPIPSPPSWPCHSLPSTGTGRRPTDGAEQGKGKRALAPLLTLSPIPQTPPLKRGGSMMRGHLSLNNICLLEEEGEK